jgi:hypothetical protein
VLSVEAPGVQALRQQAAVATVVVKCSCGCATIDLAVDPSLAPRSTLTRSPVIETRTKPSADDDPTVPFELLLFLDDGWLSSLEIVYYEDTVPREFPTPEDFEPPHVRTEA